MTDLKLYQDRKRAADEEVIRLKSEISALDATGADEDLQKALDLLPSLEEANRKAEEATRMYHAMREASINEKGAASLFVANPEGDDEAGEEDEKVMSLADFNALSPRDRLKFAKAGGRLID